MRSNFKIIILSFVALVVAVVIIIFFYQYSQRSKADSLEIPATFSKSEISLSPEQSDGITNSVDINFTAGQYFLNGATVLISYPKNIISVSIDNLYCKNLDADVLTEVNETEGTIIITRVSLKPNADLPTGLVCFARLNLTPIQIGTGTLAFVNGPIENREWEIVGLDHTFTPLYADQSVAITVESVLNAPSVSPSPTPSISPSVTPTIIPPSENLTPTTVPAPTGEGNVRINIRIQGVTTQPKIITDIPVKISFSKDGDVVDIRSINFTVNSDNTWTGSGQYDNLQTEEDYTLLIKGPKHIQKKVCDISPTEEAGGTYKCVDGQIRFQAEDTTLDLSEIILLAGDLPLQNGIVDAVDIAYVRNNSGSQQDDVLARADLNYDGIVDSQDYTMIINSLSFKYDEEE